MSEPKSVQTGRILGPVCLRIRDLEAELEFYQNDLGLRARERADQTVELTPSTETTEPIIVLRHDPEAKKAPSNSAGLYHYAILLPDRKSLAQAYVDLGNAGVVFEGYADHLVSEALYLSDPEGNGIEIYADRPKNQWPHDADGDLQIGTYPLDIDSLLKELSGLAHPEPGLPEGTRLGHIHLKVTEIKRSVDFYKRVLGFDIMNYWGNAAFLSTAGYHHHIGLNTWESLMGGSCMNGSAGLEYFTITMPDSGHLQALISRLGDVPFEMQDPAKLSISDPDGIRLIVGTTI